MSIEIEKIQPNFFQCPNVVVDELIQSIGGAALKCYLVIIRKTTGWHKLEDRISITQFMEMTGLSNRTVIDACNELKDIGLISINRDDFGNKFFSLKNYEIASEKTSRGEKTSRVASEKTSHTKDTLTKENKKNSASESLEEKAQVEKLKQGQFAKPDSFQITFEWRPTANFETRCKMAGKDFAKFNADILMSFINYNESREQYKTQKEWEALLLTAFTRELAKPAAKAQSTYKPFEKTVSPENAASASDFVATKKEAVSEEEKARRKAQILEKRKQEGKM